MCISLVLQVIVAGAGGAAHLPGMVASMTPLPVIGVPVKPSGSHLDGIDALLSIVQVLLAPTTSPHFCVILVNEMVESFSLSGRNQSKAKRLCAIECIQLYAIVRDNLSPCTPILHRYRCFTFGHLKTYLLVFPGFQLTLALIHIGS